MLRKLGYDPNAGPEQYGLPNELVKKKEEELRKNANIYIQKEEEIKKERQKITEILNKAKQAKLAKEKNYILQTSTNNENINNNDILPAPIGAYVDSSQQQPAKDAYNSALLNTGQQHQAKNDKDNTVDNLSASLNYNNLAEALNLDELNNIRSKVKRLASGYGTIVSKTSNQILDNNNVQQRPSAPYRDNSDDLLLLKSIHNLSSENKIKTFNKNSKSPSMRFKDKKRKFL